MSGFVGITPDGVKAAVDLLIKSVETAIGNLGFPQNVAIKAAFYAATPLIKALVNGVITDLNEGNIDKLINQLQSAINTTGLAHLIPGSNNIRELFMQQSTLKRGGGTKKPAKKSAKKSAKKPAKKVAKKVAKKPAKKVAKKTSKK